MRKYRVNWGDRSNYTAKVFEDFLTNPAAKALLDVKLTAEGQDISAHRLVLSACSSYFEKILCAESERQIVICIPGVTFELLQAMVLFIYRGEIIVPEDRYAAFMALAKCLGVKCLSNYTQQCVQPRPVESPPIRRKRLMSSAIVHVPEGKGNSVLAADVRNVAQTPKERKSLSRAIEIQGGLPNGQQALKKPIVSFSPDREQPNNLVVNEHKALSHIHGNPVCIDESQQECLGTSVDCLEVPGNSDQYESDCPDDACCDLKEIDKKNPQERYDDHNLTASTLLRGKELSRYKCASCGKAFTTSLDLEQHMKFVCQPHPVVDNFGSSSFTVSESNAATSLGPVEDLSIYGDQIPGRVLQSATSILGDQETDIISQRRPRRSCTRTPTPEKELKCTHCDKTFCTKVSLTNHLPKCPYLGQAKRSVTHTKASRKSRAV